ncbi:MAG TPA: cytoplasmic protein [Spirochaetota bacterium]|nr:cytoplasmic protein [Spirochaetota bacterium]HOR45008.1 cytoplasmic protein [Spirochaetota bacterium]
MSSEKDIITAHYYSSNHKNIILNDKICGCFYCLKTFSPSQIIDWIEDTEGTALCPYCGIDSVIGESSGYPITHKFLDKMNKYWF